MIVTATTRLSGPEMRGISEEIRAEALFASWLQPSESPTAEQIRAAITATLRRFGNRHCVAVLAGEFGDCPQTAAARMRWALATVRGVYADREAVASAL